jgi:hypothetical protein
MGVRGDLADERVGDTSCGDPRGRTASSRVQESCHGKGEGVSSNSGPSSEPIGDAVETDGSIPAQRVDSPGGVASGSAVEDVDDGVVILGYN